MLSFLEWMSFGKKMGTSKGREWSSTINRGLQRNLQDYIRIMPL